MCEEKTMKGDLVRERLIERGITEHDVVDAVKWVRNELEEKRMTDESKGGDR